MPAPRDQLPILSLASAAEWERWLEEHHVTAPGVWLTIPKKGRAPGPTYPEAVEIAMCFGWIDGQKAPRDDAAWLQRFTPRSPRSKWSQVNRAKASKLVEQGRMRPAGLDEIERAKTDGRWEAAYAPQSTATVPEDLQRELERNPKAAAFFATLTGANRYAILYRIHDAKRPETRAKRIKTFVDMLARNEKLYP